MKDQYELAEKLKGLPELYDQVHKLFTTSEEEMEQLGLLMAEEWVVLEKVDRVQCQASDAKNKAEQEFGYPEQASFLPKDFLQLCARRDELKVKYQQVNKVSDIVRYFMPSTWYSEGGIASKLGLGDLARDVLEKMKQLPDPLSAELSTLEHRIDCRQRQGTIVNRLRTQHYDKWNEEKQEVAQRAYEAVLAQYKDLLQKERSIQSRIVTRRKEKLEPIRAQIETMLTKALRG